MDELQFRKNIIRLRAKGKQQDNALSKEDIKLSFVPENISDAQLELVYSYLNEEGITLFNTESELDDYRNGSTETSDDLNASDDNSDSGKPSEVKIEESRESVSEYFKMYLEDLDEMDIPVGEERNAQLEMILADRKRAEEILPILYLREVVDIAKLYEGQNVFAEDLIGEGNVAILLAAKMLDCCDTKEEIEAFVTKMIMESMESLVLEAGSLDGLSSDVLGRVNDLNDKAKELSESLERKVTVSEIASELEVPEEDIIETLILSGHRISYIEDEEGVEV